MRTHSLRTTFHAITPTSRLAEVIFFWSKLKLPMNQAHQSCRHYVWTDGSLHFLQLIVPRGLWTQFIDAVYTWAMNGHPGIEKTRLKLQEITHCRCWSSDVRAYVRHCHECGSCCSGPRCRPRTSDHGSGRRWSGEASDGGRRRPDFDSTAWSTHPIWLAAGHAWKPPVGPANARLRWPIVCSEPFQVPDRPAARRPRHTRRCCCWGTPRPSRPCPGVHARRPRTRRFSKPASLLIISAKW